jgi:biopolymer transport protein ExbB
MMGVAAERRRSRWLVLLLICMLAFVSLSLVQPLLPQATAQEPADQPKDAAPKPADKEPSFIEMFWHMVTSVGIVMGIILGALQISMVALVVLLFMDLRMGDSVPPSFVEEFTEIVNKRRFKEAYELAKNDNSYLARVLTAGMARLQYGIEDAREAAMNTADSIRAGKEQLTTYLATIGSLGPLIGLVGTVYSMIGAFLKMARPDPPPPSSLAGTLSHGLVVTLVGVGLAVPAIFFNTFFRNRLTRIANEASNVADDLLTQMYHNSKKAAVATGKPE